MFCKHLGCEVIKLEHNVKKHIQPQLTGNHTVLVVCSNVTFFPRHRQRDATQQACVLVLTVMVCVGVNSHYIQPSSHLMNGEQFQILELHQLIAERKSSLGCLYN